MSSDTMKLALQLTATEMMSGVLNRVKQHVVSLGQAGKDVARDFDQMSAHITTGLKAVSVSLYGVHQLTKGITPAADLQESMIGVRMSLMRSGKDAKILNDELAEVRRTAVDLQKITPFSAKDVAETIRELKNAGLELQDINGKKGAAWATMGLATIAKVDPAETAKGLVKIGTPFDIQGNQFGELADWMQRTGMHGVAKVPDIVESMGYVAGDAARMKVPWKDTLTALSVLGEQGMVGSRGGTELKDFLVRLSENSHMAKKMVAEVNRDLKKHGRAPIEFWDDKGKLKPLLSIIQNLRQAMGGFTDKQQMQIFNKIFEMRAASAAFALLKEGNGSWEQRIKLMTEAANMEELMNARLKGFNANVTALGGTTKTTLATLFDPMLGGLTEVTKKMNDVVDLTGQFAAAHPDLTKGANYLAAGAVGAAGVYGAYHLLKGGIAGGRVLKGIGGIRGLLKGAGGTALGVAEGKAIQAATGVQPVFVTNWKDGGFGTGGAATTAAEVAAGAAGGGLLKKMAGKAGMLTKSVLPFVLGEALPMAAMTAASAGGGYLVGTGINQGLGKMSGMLSGGQYGGDGWLGSMLYDVLHGDKGRQTKNDINLSIAIDSNGRAITETSDKNTHTRINTMRRGSFTPALASSH